MTNSIAPWEQSSPRKVMIVVAPVAHAPRAEIQNPTSPEEVAEAVLACAEAGAGMAHLHVRDAHGNLTDKPDVFRRTLDLICRRSTIVIQGSTGGTPAGGIGDLSQDERVEAGSLNMGSVNMGDDPYVNSGVEIRAWAALMHAKGIRPELEIFEAGMLETVRKMAAAGQIGPPFVCGVVAGLSLPATPEVLCFVKSLLPAEALWGVIHHHMPDFLLSITALGMGATFVRVGFEDGIHYASGRIAKTNAELVRRVGEITRQLGFELATPDEIRTLLRLRNRPK
jgi:3-keto-5-aminohexanoate cleavage enzyme